MFTNQSSPFRTVLSYFSQVKISQLITINDLDDIMNCIYSQEHIQNSSHYQYSEGSDSDVHDEEDELADQEQDDEELLNEEETEITASESEGSDGELIEDEIEEQVTDTEISGHHEAVVDQKIFPEELERTRIGFCKLCIPAVSVLVISVLLMNYFTDALNQTNSKSDRGPPKTKVDFKIIENLNKLYPKSFKHNDLRIIRTRLSVMQREISVLMVIGRIRDTNCKLDPTYCVAQSIAKASGLEYSHIDASLPGLGAGELDKAFSKFRSNNYHMVLIDSLEKLPGSLVMNLFQYIDNHPSSHRRGMLLFVAYMGDSEPSHNLEKSEDLAYNILMPKWSSSIPKDTLTSVISRLCRSVVKLQQ